ncbi:MAG: FecR domain-containing protein [Gemmatimonadaceae bacterium]|jgi:ferric-dicitrate binding protein FerR (iron transport regulator)|nr:FecR domain-containing protein [Gemmatimonadaceae bacterium]
MTTPHTDLPAPLREALDAHDAADELTQLWHALGTAAPSPRRAVDHDAAWARVAARTSAPRVARSRHLSLVQGGVVRRVVPWALAAALLIGVGVTASPARRTWSAAAGASEAVTLGDGSRVQLSAGTTMTSTRDFRGWFGRENATRTVQLDGEAFFTVAKDGRPFIVRTPDAEITVLGTRFDVRAYAADRTGTTVIVEEGRVRVSAMRPVAPVELTAGLRTAVRGSTVRTDTVAVARLLAWRSGGLALVDQPMSLVFAELSRRYGVSLDMAQSASSAERLTLYYPQLPKLETVLADVTTSHGLRFERHSRGYRILSPTAVPPRGAKTDE